MSSICRAKLMAVASECGLCIWTARLSGERSPPPREQLETLKFVQVAGSRQERLETRLVLRDGLRAPAVGEFEEGSRSQQRPEPQVDEVGEAAPGRRALILLNLHVPELRLVVEVVGSHPHLLLHDALLMEVGLATIDEDEGVLRAIVLGEVHLLELRRSVVVMLARG